MEKSKLPVQDSLHQLIEGIRPLRRLDDIESRLLLRLDEQTIELHELRDQLTRLESQLSGRSKELHTALSIQEQLVAKHLETTSGEKDTPELRNFVTNPEASEISTEQYVDFLGRRLYFSDLISLYVVFKEIFLYEDYYADLGTDTPRIIDAGAHIGMATLYFKHHFPGAQIDCFEPDPDTFKLLEKNTKGFGSSVRLHPLAVTAEGQDITLFRREGMSMASSAHARSSQMSDTITVSSTRLSPHLEEPVHFLKLDIEGPEDSVLEECRDHLHNVQYVFIEFHTGNGLPISRLGKILKILDETGFTYQIERAREYQARMMSRPFTHLDHLCTHVLHAKNMSWGKKQNS